MAYIAHASLGSNGKVKNDSAGDANLKEVCIRTWYSKPFQYVLRIMNEAVRIQFANNMIDIANNNKVGYDQNERNTLLAQAKKVNFDFTKIKVACECDCSSMVITALLGAIYKVLGKEAYEKAYKVLVDNGNCARTANMKSALLKLKNAIGVDVNVYTSATYVKGTSKAVYGDIYNKEHGHVVCFIDDGKKRTIATATPEKKSIEEVAKEVIDGKIWGSGSDRKKKLEAAGYDYKEVQNKVNELLKAEKTKETEYYPKYTGSSYGIDTVLAAIGVPEKLLGSHKNRKPIAIANGLGSNYKGSQKDNMMLIELARQGKLKKS